MNWIIAIVVIVGLVWYRVSVEPERKAQEAQIIEQLARNRAEDAYVDAIAAGARPQEATLEARRAQARTRAILDPSTIAPAAAPPPPARVPTSDKTAQLRACEEEMAAKIRAVEGAGKVIDGAGALAECARIVNLVGRDRRSAIPRTIANATHGTAGHLLFGK